MHLHKRKNPELSAVPARNSRVHLKTALLLAGLTLLLIADVGAQPKAGDIKFEPYTFENSRREKVEAERGTLYVPENRANPKSRLLELAFVRFKSTSSNPGSPIVYLAGGPGGSGIGAARGSRFPLFMALREVADVIAFDQRGTGDSKPSIICPGTFELDQGAVPSYELFLNIARRRSRECMDLLKREGADLAGYTTNDSADDLEALRVALGAKKISLWGISYGTHLSLATIKRHEKSIDRAILAGIEGLDATHKLPSDVQQHLVDIATHVKADPELGKKIPDFLGLMRSVFDSLDKAPVTVEVTDPRTKQPTKVVINKFVMQFLTAATMGTGDLTRYPRFYLAASQGDYSEVAAFWLGFSRQNLGSAMAFVMDCASGGTKARMRRIERETSGSMLGNYGNIIFPDVCDAWGVADLGDGFRKPKASSVPVLFISGTLDGRTPVSNAEMEKKYFRNSHHLVLEGAWHSDPLFLSSPKIKDVMIEFMKGGVPSVTSIKLDPVKFVPLKS
jgi:pimeloyl-ACP methyl ester carboxylesterase